MALTGALPMMTPYEGALHKKWSEAVDLRQHLLNGRLTTGEAPAPEEQLLETLIQQINCTNQSFIGQLQRYQELTELRHQLAVGADASVRQLTGQLWNDIGYQFREGTVANDMLKVLCQKIHRFPLPSFPICRRKPLIHKAIYLYEDSYTQLGQYFNWLVELLKVIRFTPIRPHWGLHELQTIARQYDALNQRVRQEAETVQTLQQTQVFQYKQLAQAMKAARGRLLVQKRQSRRHAE